MSKLKIFSSWFVVVMYAGFIFTLSSLSHPPLISKIPWHVPDWLFHAVEYSLFGYFLAKAFNVSFPFRSGFLLLVITVLFGTLYGLTDEWHQSFVPERQPSLKDVLADAVGVLAGAYWWLKRGLHANDKRF